MTRVWTNAIAILNSNVKDLRQRVPEILVDDSSHGLAYVLAAMSLDTVAMKSAHGRSLLSSFLSFTTHGALLDCLSVDTFVGDIYNFMSGSGGDRAISFFRRICDILLDETATASPIGHVTPETHKLLVEIAITLLETLRRSQRVLFHTNLPALIHCLADIRDNITHDIDSASRQKMNQRIDELTRLVERARRLQHQDDNPGELKNMMHDPTISTYPRRVEEPGGRHDNDNADITQIKLFPTDGELRSEVADYLPLTDFTSPSTIHGAERLIDTHFRLLRYDIFGELKSAVGGLIRSYDDMKEFDDDAIHAPTNIRAFCYMPAVIRYVTFDRRKGMEFKICFKQPTRAQGRMTETQREKWWQESKRLEEGTLLVLLFPHEGQCHSAFLIACQKVPKSKDGFDLSSDEMANVGVRMVDAGNLQQLQLLLRVSQKPSRPRGGLLIEFPGVLPATFAPILENLQSMQRLGQIQFRKWLTDDAAEAEREDRVAANMQPAAYAQSRDLKFDLAPILKDPNQPLFLDTAEEESQQVIDELEQRTSLDRGQCEAFSAMLTREFSLIQGPPGTGKSFLGVKAMRVLLHNRVKAELGPVLVVCYTNHALDQFLENLIIEGVKKIIQIGGQSRSEMLKGFNLRAISKREDKTSNEKRRLGQSLGGAETIEKEAKKLLSTLGSVGRADWHSVEHYLRQHQPQFYQQFSRIDDEGFELAGKVQPFDLWISGDERLESSNATKDAFERVQIHQSTSHKDLNIWTLPLQERQALLVGWVKDASELALNHLSALVEEHQILQKTKTEIYDEIDRRSLEDAEVIGVTTSGLARRISILRHLRIRVVMCEEAGEVLEAHMLSALLPHAQHLIQIGDHQQLRPQINTFGLSMETPGRPPFPVSQLNVQRRMRPEISSLVQTPQYPRLQDHASVAKLPCVVGMRDDVYWFDHDRLEDNLQRDTAGTSKSNAWEVNLVQALVRHLVRQGVYSSKDIAVLTPYTGQLQKLRRTLGTDFEVVLSDRDEEKLAIEGLLGDSPNDANDEVQANDISNVADKGSPTLIKKSLNELLRIATVDNFQGEEAKVVIISLVRSNAEKRVGFLKTENRINVLLSRAQHGMYLIGNAETYGNVPMWATVLGMLRYRESVGNAFRLCCPRHPETAIEVSDPEQFASLSPEGGCRLTCDQRLDDCGHRCMAKCHSAAMHRAFSCLQPCERLHQPCGHACPKSCGETCGRCMVLVHDVALPCEHVVSDVKCHMTADREAIHCPKIVTKTVPNCGHEIEAKCGLDVIRDSFVCPRPCGTALTCGHICAGSCGECSLVKKTIGDADHVPCGTKCKRPRPTCQHLCMKYCHAGQECGPCDVACEVRCEHSKCAKLCKDSCAPCVEPCVWQCEHQGRCTMPCSAPCNRLPCSERCTLMLNCGHQCPSICGEDCPSDLCQQCCSNDKKSRIVDMIEFKELRDVNLDEIPIVLLSCGHFFTAETLDGLMQMGDVYKSDPHSGSFKALQDGLGQLAKSIPQCPDCRRPIRQFSTRRYNRVVNRAVLDEMSKRFLVSGQTELRDLTSRLAAIANDIESARKSVADADAEGHLHAQRHVSKAERQAGKLLVSLRTSAANFDVRSQPARKLRDAIARATRSNSAPDGSSTVVTIPEGYQALAAPDHRVSFGFRLLKTKVTGVFVEHRIHLASLTGETGSNVPTALKLADVGMIKDFFVDCHVLIQDCSAGKLPKIGVEASLLYASTALIVRGNWIARECEALSPTEYVEMAKELLDKALEACLHNFDGADALRTTILEFQGAMKGDHYETISAAELALVKSAMVSGRGGISTHSGHWYNCRNRHPFAIGECGRPMQQARCPECGEPVGGASHQLLEGNTRAVDMER